MRSKVSLGRVTTNVLLRDLDLEIADRTDTRRLEVAVRGDGSARRGASGEDGMALTAARRRKERRYPELVGTRSWARLLVAGVEVGGRWSDEIEIRESAGQCSNEGAHGGVH